MTQVVRSYPLYGLATPANFITMSRIALTPVLCAMVLNDVDSLGTSWAAFQVTSIVSSSDHCWTTWEKLRSRYGLDGMARSTVKTAMKSPPGWALPEGRPSAGETW